MNVSGTVGGLIASIYMENQLAKKVQPKYTIIIKIFGSLSMLFTIAFTFLINYYKDCPHWLIYVNTGLIGLGFNAFVPFASQGFMESVYPVSEVIGFTLYFLIANIWGLVGNFLGLVGLWLITAVLIPFYLYLLIFYKTILKRYQAENNYAKSVALSKQTFAQTEND